MSSKIIRKPLPHTLASDEFASPEVRRAVGRLMENEKSLHNQISNAQQAIIELQNKPIPKQKGIADIEEYVRQAESAASKSESAASAAANEAKKGIKDALDNAVTEVKDDFASYAGQIFNTGYTDDVVESVRFKIEGKEVGSNELYWGRFFVVTKSLAANTSHVFAVDLFPNGLPWEVASTNNSQMFAVGSIRDAEDPSTYGTVFIKTRAIANGTRLRAAIYAPQYDTTTVSAFQMNILVPIKRKA